MDKEIVTQAGFAPCPTCKQYSHSIGKDELAAAFNHFQSMYAHPLRGHPMGHWFDEKTRDAAQVLMAAARLSPAPEGVDATGYAQGIEDAARLIEVHPMWVDGKSVGTDMRPASRVDLAKAIRTLSPTPVPGDERMREALENIARCSNASTDFKQVVQQLARAALTPPPKGQNDGA